MPRPGERPDAAPIASVVIPAHNEAGVLGRLLDSLRSGVEPGALEVIVACNGCTDTTAEVARERGAVVVEVDTPSKVAALTAGDAVATAFPRCYVDADVVVTGRAVAEVARLLTESDVLCAAPPVRFDSRRRPWLVRAYHAGCVRDPYMNDGHVGTGFYALSEQGRKRLDQFPDVLRLLATARHQPPADDLFVRNVFAREERGVTSGEPFVLQAPWTMRAILRRRIRMFRANLELSAHPIFRTLPGTAELASNYVLRSVVAELRAMATDPRRVPDTVVYRGIDILAMVAARWRARVARPVASGRDHTTRPPAPPSNRAGQPPGPAAPPPGP